jgi:hypothetical protein
MGRPGWLPTVESCRRITIADISRNGLMRDGWEWNSQFVWPSGFTVDAECRLEPPNCRRLRLKYQGGEYNDELQDIDETIYLQRLPQPFGGHRWYFICPSSNHRCRVLYQLPGGKRFRSRWGFRCRLQYQCQKLAPQFRNQHGAAQVAKRVLRKGAREWQQEYADWEFPPKPKWMRWKTYNRLDEKALAYERAADAIFIWRCRRFFLPGETIDGLVNRICG